MTFESRLQLIQYLDGLIKRKFKGSSADYAGKLGVSSATFFRLLTYVRQEFKIDIRYCEHTNSYKYDREGGLYFGFLPANALLYEKLNEPAEETKQENK